MCAIVIKKGLLVEGPVDGLNAFFGEELVAETEMVATKEAVVCRKGRGVHALENKVLALVD